MRLACRARRPRRRSRRARRLERAVLVQDRARSAAARSIVVLCDHDARRRLASIPGSVSQIRPYDARGDPRRAQRPRPPALARRGAAAHRPRAGGRGRLLRRLLRALRPGAPAHMPSRRPRRTTSRSRPRSRARRRAASRRAGRRARGPRRPDRAPRRATSSPAGSRRSCTSRAPTPLAPDLSDLEAWYDRGLRSLGIVWSRPNAFGEGVPFRFPASPDTGPGLTDAGRSLVVACNRLGILVDVSHLNEAGLLGRRAHLDGAARRDALERARAERVDAEPHRRAARRDRRGRAASSASTSRSASCARTATRSADTPLAEIVRHVDYIAERIGVDCVAFGSDFEGATVPAELGGIDGLPRLVEALRARGYDDEALAKITHGNWLRVLGQTWRRWGRYFDCAGDDARPTLLDALDRFAEPGLAVDLGAGTGRDTAELLRRGWSVIAIDGEREAIDRLLALAGGESPQLETRVARSRTSAGRSATSSTRATRCRSPRRSSSTRSGRGSSTRSARAAASAARSSASTTTGPAAASSSSHARRGRADARAVRDRAPAGVRRRGHDRDRLAQALARLPRRRAQALRRARRERRTAVRRSDVDGEERIGRGDEPVVRRRGVARTSPSGRSRSVPDRGRATCHDAVADEHGAVPLQAVAAPGARASPRATGTSGAPARFRIDCAEP